MKKILTKISKKQFATLITHKGDIYDWQFLNRGVDKVVVQDKKHIVIDNWQEFHKQFTIQNGAKALEFYYASPQRIWAWSMVYLDDGFCAGWNHITYGDRWDQQWDYYLTGYDVYTDDDGRYLLVNHKTKVTVTLVKIAKRKLRGEEK